MFVVICSLALARGCFTQDFERRIRHMQIKHLLVSSSCVRNKLHFTHLYLDLFHDINSFKIVSHYCRNNAHELQGDGDARTPCLTQTLNIQRTFACACVIDTPTSPSHTPLTPLRPKRASRFAFSLVSLSCIDFLRTACQFN